MAEACLVAENMNISHIYLTEKRKMFHDEIPLQTSAYNEEKQQLKNPLEEI
jgi:hypothetical protein